MKIAMFMPYFAADPKNIPALYATWLKTAAANSAIDFFVVTNLKVEERKDFGNIHYLFMEPEDFWEKLRAILDFPISHAYYKTGEYRVFFGIIFRDILRGYDYWGTTEQDIIYGDILKFISPCLEQGADVIGRYGPFRLIKNTEDLCNMPFFEVRNMDHPLTLKDAFSTDFCWYFDEIAGMNVRYHQAGIKVHLLDECIGDITVKNKYLHCDGKDGQWRFTWKEGKLIGYDQSQKMSEFLCIHLQKRKMTIEGNIDSAKTLSIVPNRIVCDCDMSAVSDVSVGVVENTAYSIKTMIPLYIKLRRQQRQMPPEAKQIFMETNQYCLENGLFPPAEKASIAMKGWHLVKKLVVWK